jgi:hypothetical protein
MLQNIIYFHKFLIFKNFYRLQYFISLTFKNVPKHLTEKVPKDIKPKAEVYVKRYKK